MAQARWIVKKNEENGSKIDLDRKIDNYRKRDREQRQRG